MLRSRSLIAKRMAQIRSKKGEGQLSAGTGPPVVARHGRKLGAHWSSSFKAISAILKRKQNVGRKRNSRTHPSAFGVGEELREGARREMAAAAFPASSAIISG